MLSNVSNIAPRVVASATPLPWRDDFTHDTVLNASLWQDNGTVGSVFGPDDCGPCSIIPLAPTFSPSGMEIAQADGKYVVGTIQSIVSFTPPFSLIAVVEGIVSNGHTFVLGVASTNASSGLAITGNLNPDNCSNLGNCGDPATCGNPANSGIPGNQCYYGIDARTGTGGGKWTKAAKLFLTPSVGVVYTVQITVDGSGSAQYSISQGGQVLGESTAQVGTGPFYVILDQSEGAVVPGPGPNQADWLSVSLTLPSSTSSTTPGPSLFGISVDIWTVVVVVIIVLFLLILLW